MAEADYDYLIKFLALGKLHFSTLHGMQHGLAIRKVSICLSNACIVTKRKKDLSRFLYLTKDHLA